jgi:hypothetical protein
MCGIPLIQETNQATARILVIGKGVDEPDTRPDIVERGPSERFTLYVVEKRSLLRLSINSCGRRKRFQVEKSSWSIACRDSPMYIGYPIETK